MTRITIHEDYLRSMVFGFQDALVSTTGVIIGISVAVNQRNVIMISALVTIIVEALSMAAGQYLSEKSVHQLSGNHHRDSLLLGSIFMFLAYVLGGSIPVIPILISSDIPSAFTVITFSLIGLFVLGVSKTKITGSKSAIKNAFEMVVIGGLAVVAGSAVGFFLKLK